MWRGGFLAVEDLSLRDPHGEPFNRYVVRHPGSVGVVAVDGDEALLVDMHRPAMGRRMLEIPAGKLDVTGEDPEAAGRRELREEAGMEAASWRHLVTASLSPGFCDEVVHIFRADGLTDVGHERQGAEEADMRIVRLPLSDVRASIADGRLADAKSIIGLLLAR